MGYSIKAIRRQGLEKVFVFLFPKIENEGGDRLSEKKHLRGYKFYKIGKGVEPPYF